MTDMLKVKNLSLDFFFDEKVIDNINFDIKENTINLLAGKSGCGKSSLLMCLARVIPETIEANMTGEILFQGENIEDKNSEHISGEIAYMFQDPDSQLCTFTVEDEIAFGLENMNVDQKKMESIIDKTLNLVGISNLKYRHLNKLSGGEKQKVALASILAINPKLILMDEPTANLDPVSTFEIVNLIKKLRDEMGKTIIIIEHKIKEFEHIIDNVIKVENKTTKIVDKCEYIKKYKESQVLPIRERKKYSTKDPVLEVKDLCYAYSKNHNVLNNINFTLNKGEITALVGYNGAGKSTLTKLLIGFIKPFTGQIILNNKKLHKLNPREIGENMGLVFQNPEHQFIKMTVEKELSLSLEIKGLDEEDINEKTKSYLRRFDLLKNSKDNPFLLSQGQKRRLSTASMMINGQSILILDEPTYGQDKDNMKELVELLYKVNEEGISILIISHDMDLVSSCCDKVIYLDKGEIIYEGRDIDIVEELFLQKRRAINEQ